MPASATQGGHNEQLLAMSLIQFLMRQQKTSYTV